MFNLSNLADGSWLDKFGKKYLLYFAIGLVLLGSGIFSTVSTHYFGRGAATGTGAVSPYLFGSNLTLTDGNDAFLTDPKVQQYAQQLHLTMLRFPDRGDIAVTTAAAKEIKALGIMPLLILHINQLASDQQLIAMMNSVFGASTVYYEYGNEKDINGVNGAQYTQSWNALIPTLKQLAPNAKFVGPVTATYNQPYITTFLQGAQPRPDAISWHEYPCYKPPLSAQTCLQHIDNWSVHIAKARTVMQQTLGTNLPIMITEYNWACCPNGDPLTRDTNFLASWTARALQVLAQNQVFAANQYALNNNSDLQMIGSSGAQTGQSQAFAQAFVQMQSSLSANVPISSPTCLPGSAVPTPTATVTSTPSVSAVTPTATNQPTQTQDPDHDRTPTATNQPTQTQDQDHDKGILIQPIAHEAVAPGKKDTDHDGQKSLVTPTATQTATAVSPTLTASPTSSQACASPLCPATTVTATPSPAANTNVTPTATAIPAGGIIDPSAGSCSPSPCPASVTPLPTQSGKTQGDAAASSCFFPCVIVSGGSTSVTIHATATVTPGAAGQKQAAATVTEPASAVGTCSPCRIQGSGGEVMCYAPPVQ